MQIRHKYIAYMLLMPAFILICVFKLYPIASTLVEGFISNGKLSLAVYGNLFVDPTFWNSLWVTIKFNIITIPLQVFISLCMALLFNAKAKGIGVYRTIAYMPYAVSLTVAVMIWGLMFNYNNGIINSLIRFMGFDAQGFLNDKRQALFCIIIIATWKGCGYWMMYLLAGLKNIDASIYEAAKIDGVNWLSKITKITLPLLKNVMLFVCVANTTSNVLLFAPMQLYTYGGPQQSTNVLMYEAYRTAFKYADRPRSAAIVTVLLLIIVLVSFLQFQLMGNKDAEKGRKANKKVKEVYIHG